MANELELKLADLGKNLSFQNSHEHQTDPKEDVINKMKQLLKMEDVPENSIFIEDNKIIVRSHYNMGLLHRNTHGRTGSRHTTITDINGAVDFFRKLESEGIAWKDEKKQEYGFYIDKLLEAENESMLVTLALAANNALIERRTYSDNPILNFHRDHIDRTKEILTAVTNGNLKNHDAYKIDDHGNIYIWADLVGKTAEDRIHNIDKFLDRNDDIDYIKPKSGENQYNSDWLRINCIAIQNYASCKDFVVGWQEMQEHFIREAQSTQKLEETINFNTTGTKQKGLQRQ